MRLRHDGAMTRIILTRHGHVDGISPLRFRGQTELPLTARGRAQASATAARIAASWQPRAVYTSPMGRCVATGQAIADACGAPSEILPELIDLNYGAWQWRTVEDVRAAWPDLLAAWYATPHLVRFPDGDALQDLVARTANAVRSVLARHPEETLVMVGHETANRAILLQLLDQPLSAYWRFAQEPCAINEIEIAAGTVRVRSVNDVSHLSGIP
jgi:phosphoserine phosphatase